MINQWISKSFGRQVAIMLLLVGVISNSIHAAFEFQQEHNHYKNFIQQQALQLGDTLRQTLANDVHYKNYYTLWYKIREVFQNNRAENKEYSLIVIDEIAVTNTSGKILSHTQPQKFRLNSDYSNAILNTQKQPIDKLYSKWDEEKNKLFVYSPITFNKHIDGYILITYNTLPLESLKSRSLKTYAITQGLIFILIAFITVFFTKKISRPLNSIIDSIPDMGTGTMEIKSSSHRQDEFRTLSETLKQADRNIFEAHQKAIQQQQKFSAIVDNSNAIIYMKDLQGNYLLCNRPYSNIIHIPIEKMIGKTDFDIFPEDFAKKSRSYEQRVLKSKIPLHYEEAIQIENELKTYITVKFPINDDNGNIYAIAGISTDITQRKKMEEELIEYKEKLEIIVEKRTHELSETLREMESFSYSVSHDLRSPLRSINGFSLALKEDYSAQLDDTANDYINRIVRATDRMADIIDDLLLLSRVHRQEIQKQDINLSQIAEQVYKELQSNEPDRHIDCFIQKDIHSHGDEKLIHLLLENLLGNAWKYTKYSSQPKIYFGMENRNNKNIFYIKDNGAGFDMKYVNKLFQAFQRLHGAEYEGTGIGLATVYRIIQRHNGNIWAESTVGQGATFYFTL